MFRGFFSGTRKDEFARAGWARRGLVSGGWPQPFPGYFETPTPLLDPIQSGRERVDVCGVKLGSAVEVMEEHHGSCAARTGD